jgi:hypothetical protein
MKMLVETISMLAQIMRSAVAILTAEANWKPMEIALHSSSEKL